MFKDIPITFFSGTYRIKDPKETIAINEPKLKIAGITRLTEITDLDRIGIPVFSAIRPTAQEGSVSIYAGKGATKNQAKASAIMEGFERYSAEKQDKDTVKIKIASFDELKKEFNTIHPQALTLPKNNQNEKIANLKLEWIESEDIISEQKIYVPANAVFHPYIPTKNNIQNKNNTNSTNIQNKNNTNIQNPIAIFKGNTNGLASGNVIEEAVLHGIFEVIERDAWSIFELTKKNEKQIATENIDNEIITDILNKFNEESVKIKLMDLTADLKIPTIAATADDTLLKDPALLTLGVGTHLNPEIAAIRALTEVAQSRATQIHGTREDTARADFMRKAGYERMKKINKHYFNEEENKINLSDITNKSTNSIKKDIEISIEEIQKVGLNQILYTNLTREEIGISVARVIIPGTELYSLDPERVGERAINYDRQCRLS